MPITSLGNAKVTDAFLSAYVHVRTYTLATPLGCLVICVIKSEKENVHITLQALSVTNLINTCSCCLFIAYNRKLPG